MSTNFYYKGNDVKTLIKGISDNTNFSKYSNNLDFGSTTITSDFTSSINENPTSIGYYNNNTDLSTFCIANYIEYSSAQTNTLITIPSWCNKIKGVIAAPGGYGAPSYKIINETKTKGVLIGSVSRTILPTKASNSTDVRTDYTTTEVKQKTTVNRFSTDHQTPANLTTTTYKLVISSSETIKTGANGGGGAYYYFNTIDITNNRVIKLNIPSSSPLNAVNTILTIGTPSTPTPNITYNIAGGSPGTSTVTTTSEGASGIFVSLGSGSGESGLGSISGLNNVLASSSSLKTNVGNGGTGGSTTVSGNPGNTGKVGYARIYFLAN